MPSLSAITQAKKFKEFSREKKKNNILSLVKDAVSQIEIPRPRDGADGKDGIPGRAGRDGTNGRDGLQGPKGDQGPRGFPGMDGTTTTIIKQEYITPPDLSKYVTEVQFEELEKRVDSLVKFSGRSGGGGGSSLAEKLKVKELEQKVDELIELLNEKLDTLIANTAPQNTSSENLITKEDILKDILKELVYQSEISKEAYDSSLERDEIL